MRSKIFELIIIMFLSILSFGVLVTLEVKEGQDWETPYVNLKYAGIFQNAYLDIPAYSNDLNDILNCKMVTLSWKILNPEQNVFRFDILKKILERVKTEGKCLILRLKNHVVERKSPWTFEDESYVPNWVLSICNPPIVTMKEDEEELIKVAAPWNGCLTKMYLKFIDKFGETRILEDPNLFGVYIHGISSSFGEEFWFTKSALDEAQEKGMTPQKLFQAYKMRFLKWADVAKEYVGKLVWVGSTTHAPDEKYSEVFLKLNLLAEKLGMGIRDGALENPHRWLLAEKRAIVYDRESEKIKLNQYFKFNEKNLYGEYRYFGDEIENPSIIGYDSELFESSIFMAKLLGMNFLWIPKDVGFVLNNIDILKWFMKTQGGKNYGNEVSIWLREDYLKSGFMLEDEKRIEKCSKVKNFEIGLYQIETKGSITKPVKKKVAHSVDYMDCVDEHGKHFDYIARSTIVKTENRRIDFKIDDDFKRILMEKGGILKIVFYNDTKSLWTIENPCGYNFPALENDGKGGLRTAVFHISKEVFCEKRFQNGADFRIKVLNKEDLTVKIVRLIINPY